jgi:gluconokinase
VKYGENLIILLMGVSGAGKTTIGQLLASELGWEFEDADDYHSPKNVEKMRAGTPLTDADRGPWLETLRALIGDRVEKKQNMILACSALKQAYRRVLQVTPEIKIVYLKGTAEIFRQRLSGRRGHYMTERMLDSQLEALEAPEDALVVDVDRSPAEIVAEIRGRFSQSI